MRVRFYQAAATGNQEQALQEVRYLYAESVKQINTALNDLNGAVRYIVDGDRERPNRIDVTEGRTGSFFSTGAPPFSGPVVSKASMPAFGQPSALGSQKQDFGNPSTLRQQPAFGQPSVLGHSSTFGQPSALGAGAQSSAFGKPSPLGGQPAFGKPALGQPTFGQPSTLGTSPFGKPSHASPFLNLLDQNQGPSVFQQASGNPAGFAQPPAPSPFGQPSDQPPPSPFGQLTSPTGGASAFGKPSTVGGVVGAFGQPSPISSPFSQVSLPVSPFIQPTPSSAWLTIVGHSPVSSSSEE
jgi:nucleoporin NUP42